MNVQILRAEAVKYNAKFFANEIDLSRISFRVSNKMTRTLGQYRRKVRGSVIVVEEIILSSMVTASESNWRNTLVHELVHAWQIHTNHGCSHDFWFHSKSRDIAKIDPCMIIERVADTLDTEAALVQTQIKDRRLANTTQYTLIKHKHVLFAKNLTVVEIRTLREKGYTVHANDIFISSVRNCKNFSYILNANYYYPYSILKKYNIIIG